jgi:hypothetical protein
MLLLEKAFSSLEAASSSFFTAFRLRPSGDTTGAPGPVREGEGGERGPGREVPWEGRGETPGPQVKQGSSQSDPPPLPPPQARPGLQPRSLMVTWHLVTPSGRGGR